MEDQQEDGKSASRINVVVKNQDGRQLYFKVGKSMLMEKLLRAYCERGSLDVDSVAFLYDGAFIQRKQTAEELGIVENDIIYAIYADSLACSKRNKPSLDVKEGSQGKFLVKVKKHEENEIVEMDNLITYSFNELEDRATCSFVKAMSFLKASFLKSNRLTEDARKCMEEVQSMTQSLNDVISAKSAAEKKLADRDIIIEQMNKDLQCANAEISNLSKDQSRLSEELLKVEKKLVDASKEITRVRKEVEAAKHAAALAEASNKRKRARLDVPVKIQQSAVVESCTLDKDVLVSEMSVGREGMKSEDCSKHVYLKVIDHSGKGIFYKCRRNTQLLKVMQAYCSRENKDFKLTFFKFKNTKIESEQTPDELQMVNGDEIQVARKHTRIL